MFSLTPGILDDLMRWPCRAADLRASFLFDGLGRPSHTVSLAQITFEPLWKDHGIPLAVMGIIVVFAALVLVSVFITLLPHIMAALHRLHPEKVSHRHAKKEAKPPAQDELPEEIAVVIAAAVAEAISAPHRIVRTRVLRPDGRGWSLEGRIQHHTSHGRRERG